MRWIAGEVATLHMEFAVGTTPTDPTTVELLVQDPVGNLDTYAAADCVHVGTGIYEKDIALDDEGQWLWRWVGTGTCPTADEGNIVVRNSEFVDNDTVDP